MSLHIAEFQLTRSARSPLPTSTLLDHLAHRRPQARAKSTRATRAFTPLAATLGIRWRRSRAAAATGRLGRAMQSDGARARERRATSSLSRGSSAPASPAPRFGCDAACAGRSPRCRPTPPPSPRPRAESACWLLPSLRRRRRWRRWFWSHDAAVGRRHVSAGYLRISAMDTRQSGICSDAGPALRAAQPAGRRRRGGAATLPSRLAASRAPPRKRAPARRSCAAAGAIYSPPCFARASMRCEAPPTRSLLLEARRFVRGRWPPAGPREPTGHSARRARAGPAGRPCSAHRCRWAAGRPALH